MKISMAMTVENAPPECGAFVAHCSLEFDEESSSQPQDVDGFQHNVHAVLVACCRAVHDELRRQRDGHCAVAGSRHGAGGLAAQA